MITDFNILTFFIIGWFILAPIYLFYRIRITRNAEDRHLSYYTKRRIFNITLIELMILLIVIADFSLLFFSIKARRNLLLFNNYEILLFLAFFILVVIISFGVGSYVTSIITEQFTLKDLKRHSSFNTLFLVNEFYHGPVSHLLIYSTGLILFLLIAILEFFNPIKEMNTTLLISYLIYGIIFGSAFLAAQIVSFTWKHQMPVALIANVIDVVFIVKAPVDFWKMPFNLFYLTMITVFSLGLVVKFIHHKVKKTVYRYD